MARIIAYGGTKFSLGRAPVFEQMAQAAQAALASEPRIGRADIDGLLTSTNDGAKYLSAIVSESLGISPRVSHAVECMCSSGAGAVSSACAYAESAMAGVVLVAGADERGGPGQVLQWDAARGQLSRPTYWASILASAYKRRHGASAKHIASVPAKNRKNAADNPLAYEHSSATIPEVLESRKITDDLRLYECSRACTGASALIIASEDAARRLKCQDCPRISGIGHMTAAASVSSISDWSFLGPSAAAARAALAMAKKEPRQIGVAEVHDAFAVCEPMALEAAGIAERGKGAQMSFDLYETQSRMVNPRGGLIGAGHPLAASGIAQAAEVAAQVSGRAGKRQAEGAEAGLVHSMAAAGTSATVMVIER